MKTRIQSNNKKAKIQRKIRRNIENVRDRYGKELSDKCLEAWGNAKEGKGNRKREIKDK